MGFEVEWIDEEDLMSLLKRRAINKQFWGRFGEDYEEFRKFWVS